MYAFKGLAAEALFMRPYPISGTQMQHALGEMFKHDNLHRIFAYYDLDKYIRHSADFETDRHRHIFVFGLLGWLFVHASNEVKKEFIELHFLSALSHLFVSQPRQHDLAAQCNVFSRMLYDKPIAVDMKQMETGLWQAIVSVNGETIAVESSSSYRYARRKSLKAALLALSARAQQIDRESEDYELRQQQLEDFRKEKIRKDKEVKLAAQKEKEEQKRAERKAVKAHQEEQKRQLDMQRKQAKASAKKRKEEQQRLASLAAAKLQNMSANKRRHLQDKGQF